MTHSGPGTRLASSENDIRRIVCTREVPLPLWEGFALLRRPVRLSDIVPYNPVNPSAAFLFSGQRCYQAVVVRSATGAWFDALKPTFYRGGLLKYAYFLAAAALPEMPKRGFGITRLLGPWHLCSPWNHGILLPPTFANRRMTDLLTHNNSFGWLPGYHIIRVHVKQIRG